MPFFGDIDTEEEQRGPIWGPFATIRDNVERLVLLNIGWSIQLLPGILALAFPQLSVWLRIAMGLYSATVLIPATGALYALSLAVTRGEHLSWELTWLTLRELAIPSFRTLTPLYGVFGVLIWAGILGGRAVPSVATLATLAFLFWYLCATFFGPLFAYRPKLKAGAIAVSSIQFVWRYPLEALASGFVAAVALVIGMISVGGLFLIVPVVITLLHTERYLDLIGREQAQAVRE